MKNDRLVSKFKQSPCKFSMRVLHNRFNIVNPWYVCRQQHVSRGLKREIRFEVSATPMYWKPTVLSIQYKSQTRLPSCAERMRGRNARAHSKKGAFEKGRMEDRYSLFGSNLSGSSNNIWVV